MKRGLERACAPSTLFRGTVAHCTSRTTVSFLDAAVLGVSSAGAVLFLEADHPEPLAPDGAQTAVLIMNNDPTPANLTLRFDEVPGVGCIKCRLRD